MKPLSQINVIPFIDIMLVLLAIVLTTATFVAQGKIPLDLPQANHPEPASFDRHLEISIDLRGVIHLGNNPVDSGELNRRLKEHTVDTAVILRVDSQSAFEHFVSVIDELKALGMTNLSIVTRTNR